jgi:cell division protein FtsW
MLRRYAPDFGLVFAVFGLVTFGLVMLSSLSVYNSYTKVFTQKVIEYCDAHTESVNCVKEEGREYAQGFCAENNCNNLYFKRQVQNAGFAILVFFVGFFVPLTIWRTIAPLIFLGGIILLLLVFSPLGTGYGTSRSWLNIPLFRSLQPVEVAKIGIIFYFAIWMSKKQNTIQTLHGGFLPFVVLVSMMIIPVALQPDFGSVLVLGCIATFMFFVAGGNIFHIIGGGALASLLAWPIILSHKYVRVRFESLFFPNLANENDLYQIDQSLRGIGSGGWFGAGLGEGTQRYGWLPEIQGDFIFSGIAEEIGFIRILIILFAFFYIGIRGLKISRNAPDRFSSLVATGITVWIITQAIINILVTVRLFPLTGITLPFLSYGGSSLVTMLFAVGILLNISTLSPPELSSGRKSKSLGTRWLSG